MSEQQAEKMMMDFQTSLKSQNYEQALTYYSDSFFNMTPRETWLAYLKEVQEKLGSFQRYELKEKSINTVFSGKRFMYIYRATYSKAIATETIVLEQLVSNEGAKIVVHKIESKALDK